MTPKNKEEIKKRGHAYRLAGKRKAKRKKPQIKSKNKSIGWLLILISILLVFLLMIESVQIFLQFKDLTKKVVDNQQSASPVYIVDSQAIDFDVYLHEHFAGKVPKKTMQVTVSAYSSTNGQTDDTPYLTAFGTHVRDGIVAANFLPVGTVIRFPDKFGDKLFVVEDRMNERFSLQV
ncbi:hypothetical protein L6250_03930, partial [Candidatus Parcubacteria bacterium]|nr:hypothetical protein [Candidatus Parcubacteria bacterium]